MALPLSPKQYSFMRGVHNALMTDACYLVIVADGVAVYNIPAKSYTTGTTAQPCGFDPTGGNLELGAARVVEYSGTFRLPHGTPIDNLGGFRLIQQAGEPITPRSYKLTAPPEYGPTAITCRVESVTDQSF